MVAPRTSPRPRLKARPAATSWVGGRAATPYWASAAKTTSAEASEVTHCMATPAVTLYSAVLPKTSLSRPRPRGKPRRGGCLRAGAIGRLYWTGANRQTTAATTSGVLRAPRVAPGTRNLPSRYLPSPAPPSLAPSAPEAPCPAPICRRPLAPQVRAWSASPTVAGLPHGLSSGLPARADELVALPFDLGLAPARLL